MSEKLNKQLRDKKKYTLDEIEFNFLRDIDTVQRSVNFYQDQLKTNYLQQVAVRIGYLPEDKLEFTIDLQNPSHELTIKRVKE